MHCTQCSSDSSCKNGSMRGQQRYRCLACSYNYTGGVGVAYPDEQRQLALKLYLEGMGLRAIGRVLGVSNVTVLRWVRAAGQRAEQQADAAPGQAVRIAEVDELYRYVGRKKRLLGLARGRPGAALFGQLRRHTVELVCTDYFDAYPRLVPVHLHYRSKADTTSVEGCNSLLRHYRARFHRRGKCYGKTTAMLLLSVLLFSAKKNGTLATLW